ncbi:MAG: hypothetical protein LBQ24_03380 [Candidatus Peribacteria bacterium]|jgi:hypothetical protein|nr:hypothetical protein [Candidatus Peribacteria bacterium]
MANSGIQTITSSIFQKYFIHSGKTELTKIAIFQFIFNLSSFSFIIQDLSQDLVFLLSQTIVQVFCHKLFLTVWIKSAHLIQVGTSSIISIGNAKDKACFKSFS